MVKRKKHRTKEKNPGGKAKENIKRYDRKKCRKKKEGRNKLSLKICPVSLPIIRTDSSSIISNR